MVAVAPDALGIYASIASGPITDPFIDRFLSLQDRTLRKFFLQDAAASLLHDERVSECCRQIAPMFNSETGSYERGKRFAQVNYSQSSGKARYGNLKTCGSVWMCPVCSSRIAGRRGRDLAAALPGSGFDPLMLTFTFSHGLGDDLASLVARVSEAMRRFKSGRWFADICSLYGWVADIRSLEMTYGSNGFHPHMHMLALFKSGHFGRAAPGLLDSVNELQEVCRVRWLSCLQKEGLTGSWDRALVVSSDNARIVEYVSKFGREPAADGFWSDVDELTKSHIKLGRSSEHFTMWQMLAAFALQRDLPGLDWQRAGRLFKVYALTLKGRNQLVKSRNFDALLGIEVVSDEQIMLDREDYLTIALLDELMVTGLAARRLRGEVLKVAQDSGGDGDRVREFVRQALELPVKRRKKAVGHPELFQEALEGF